MGFFGSSTPSPGVCNPNDLHTNNIQGGGHANNPGSAGNGSISGSVGDIGGQFLGSSSSQGQGQQGQMQQPQTPQTPSSIPDIILTGEALLFFDGVMFGQVL